MRAAWLFFFGYSFFGYNHYCTDCVALFSYISTILNLRTICLARNVVGKPIFFHILTLDSYLEENKREDDERLKDVSLRIRKVNLCDGKHPSLSFLLLDTSQAVLWGMQRQINIWCTDCPTFFKLLERQDESLICLYSPLVEKV